MKLKCTRVTLRRRPAEDGQAHVTQRKSPRRYGRGLFRGEGLSGNNPLGSAGLYAGISAAAYSVVQDARAAPPRRPLERTTAATLRRARASALVCGCTANPHGYAKKLEELVPGRPV